MLLSVGGCDEDVVEDGRKSVVVSLLPQNDAVRIRAGWEGVQG